MSAIISDKDRRRMQEVLYATPQPLLTPQPPSRKKAQSQAAEKDFNLHSHFEIPEFFDGVSASIQASAIVLTSLVTPSGVSREIIKDKEYLVTDNVSIPFDSLQNLHDGVDVMNYLHPLRNKNKTGTLPIGAARDVLYKLFTFAEEVNNTNVLLVGVKPKAVYEAVKSAQSVIYYTVAKALPGMKNKEVMRRVLNDSSLENIYLRITEFSDTEIMDISALNDRLGLTTFMDLLTWESETIVSLETDLESRFLSIALQLNLAGCWRSNPNWVKEVEIYKQVELFFSASKIKKTPTYHMFALNLTQLEDEEFRLAFDDMVDQGYTLVTKQELLNKAGVGGAVAPYPNTKKNVESLFVDSSDALMMKLLNPEQVGGGKKQR